MKSINCYYLILSVYLLLWLCQTIACHSTHSLIILTDSYINLYKILDISLGILHIRTQSHIRKRSTNQEQQTAPIGEKQPIRLFGRICTYQFGRLPVLGSFVNGLFLGALLMSAAIEGIQTCFHAKHSIEDKKSILLDHPITYPAILFGFAFVGAFMQWCSNQAHKMREEELGSESILNLQEADGENLRDILSKDQGLDVNRLLKLQEKVIGKEKSNTICLGSRLGSNNFQEDLVTSANEKSTLASNKFKSCDSVLPNENTGVGNSQISLKSLRMLPNEHDTSLQSIKCVTSSVKAGGADITQTDLKFAHTKKVTDNWAIVRYSVAPTALVLCASVVYFLNDELITEITDVALAVLVVTLLFTASYPPMKKAGKILLQSAPNGVDPELLKTSLLSIEPDVIVDIRELHVWSLTSGSTRIATCHLVIDKKKLNSTVHLSELLKKVKLNCLRQNIKCVTIQPVLLDSTH